MKTKNNETNENAMHPASLLQRIVAITAATLTLSAVGLAQFPGDVYFEDPTPTVVAGESVELTVVTFTGSQAFGALSMDLQYDPNLFEIESIEALGTEDVGLLGFTCAQAQGDRLAILNGRDLDAPFGVVQLLRIVGRPLFSGPGTFMVGIDSLRLIDSGGADFAQTTGMGALVTVTVPGPVPPPEDLGLLSWPLRPHAPLILRRPGHLIDLPSLDLPRRAVFSEVSPRLVFRTFDPRLARDRAAR